MYNLKTISLGQVGTIQVRVMELQKQINDDRIKALKLEIDQLQETNRLLDEFMNELR